MEGYGVVHAPHFLPWFGHLTRLSLSQVVVFTDDSKFRKSSLHNRTQVEDPNNCWLTLPVHASNRDTIRDVRICSSFNLKRFGNRAQSLYGRAPYFDEVWPPIRQAIRDGCPWLVDVSINILTYLINQFCASNGSVPPKILLGSELGAEGGVGRTELLAARCHLAGISALVLGDGGSLDVHNLAYLQESGLTLLHQEADEFFRAEEFSYRSMPRGALGSISRFGWSHCTATAVAAFELTHITY